MLSIGQRSCALGEGTPGVLGSRAACSVFSSSTLCIDQQYWAAVLCVLGSRTCVHEHPAEMLCYFNNAYTDRLGNIVDVVMEHDWGFEVWDYRFQLIQQIEGDEQSYVTQNGILWDHGDVSA